MGNLLPIATMVVAGLLSIAPLHIGWVAAVAPSFTLIATYHWTIYQPALSPGLALFVIGTVQDLLTGGLPGETSVTLLLCRAFVLSHRRYYADRQFPVMWADFSLVTFGAAFGLWALHSLLSAQILELRGPAVSVLATISVFPIVSFLLGRTQRMLIGTD